MRIEHIALWTKDLESMKDFYCLFFGGHVGPQYHNPHKNFTSYFITFSCGTRLELMHQSTDNLSLAKDPMVGYAHMAFSLESQEAVNRLTQELQEAGFTIVSGPRTTGDGYYESCILDPEGNVVEITV